MKKPSKSILDKTFKYTPSHLTNIGERFKQIREQAERRSNVTTLPRIKAK